MMSAHKKYLIYLDARILARRNAFLSVSVYEEMIGYSDVTLVLKHLLSTPYEHHVAEALVRHQGGDAVEAGVGAHLDDMFSDLMQMARYLPGQKNELDYFLNRWDLLSIKTLLRHAACGTPPAEHQLSTGPSLPWPLLSKLSEISDIEDLSLRLYKRFPSLCRSFPSILKSGADTPRELLELLETALDKDYFLRFTSVVPRNNTQKVIRECMAIEIDRINLRYVLSNLAQQNHSPDPSPLLPEGRLSAKVLNQMLSSGSVESALVLLESTPYRSIHQVFYQIFAQGRLSGLDRKIEMLLIEKLQMLIWRYPFSGALFMHFVWKKWIEAANLRILARGSELHLPSGRIKEELVYV